MHAGRRQGKTGMADRHYFRPMHKTLQKDCGMTPTIRYALYFTPSPQTSWHAAGSSWLGRDAFSGRLCTQPTIPGVSRDRLLSMTADARRYGFHATLKAPFRLAEHTSEHQLLEQVITFCASQQAIVLRAPHVAQHRGFLALQIDDVKGEVSSLAAQCVSRFDGLRAPLTESELAHRRRDALTPRQEVLLRRWGYPYTEEQFRFHMTLSGALQDPDIGTRLHRAATEHFATPAAVEPLVIDALSIVREAAPGAPFLVWKRCSFLQADASAGTESATALRVSAL
jgi:putative phosphonate metabolism protein